MAETELERAEKKFAQAKARLQGLRNREATRLRKMDTRRKVILGGALMDLAGRDTGAAAMLDRLLRNLPRDRDRAAFDGWSLGADGSGDGAVTAVRSRATDAAPGTPGGSVTDRPDPGAAARAGDRT